MTEVAACRKRRWDQTQRARVAARRLAPIDEIVLEDDAGEVCRFGVIRRKMRGNGTGVNHYADQGDGVSAIVEVALPRLRWLERQEV